MSKSSKAFHDVPTSVNFRKILARILKNQKIHSGPTSQVFIEFYL